MPGDGLTGEFLPKTTLACGCGGPEEVGARVVSFEYRVWITHDRQTVADVHVRTDQQDTLGRVTDDLQPFIGTLGEVAADLPAFALGVYISDGLFFLLEGLVSMPLLMFA